MAVGSSIDADMFVRYDYESAESTRPAAYPLDSLNVAGIYGSVAYGVASYGGPSQPIVKKAVEGSGFAIAIRIEDGRLVIDSEDFKNFHPTQVLETGYDILFFWVARMIIMTTYAIHDIPFEDVYLHGGRIGKWWSK